MEEVSPNVLDILFPVLFMFRAWQKQTNTPFRNNMLLEKVHLDLETLTSLSALDRHYGKKNGSELK